MITIEMPTWYAIVLLVLWVLLLAYIVLGNILATFMTKNYKLIEKEEYEMACKRKGCGKGKGKRK